MKLSNSIVTKKWLAFTQYSTFESRLLSQMPYVNLDAKEMHLFHFEMSTLSPVFSSVTPQHS